MASLFQVAYRNSFKFAYSLATNETFVLYQARPPSASPRRRQCLPGEGRAPPVLA